MGYGGIHKGQVHLLCLNFIIKNLIFDINDLNHDSRLSVLGIFRFLDFVNDDVGVSTFNFGLTLIGFTQAQFEYFVIHEIRIQPNEIIKRKNLITILMDLRF